MYFNLFKAHNKWYNSIISSIILQINKLGTKEASC